MKGRVLAAAVLLLFAACDRKQGKTESGPKSFDERLDAAVGLWGGSPGSREPDSGQTAPVQNARLATDEELRKVVKDFSTSSNTAAEFAMKKMVINAFNRKHKAAPFYFLPDLAIPASAQAEKCAQPIEPYLKFIKWRNDRNYWEDSDYMALTTLPSARLPSVAILPLLCLVPFPIPQIERGDVLGVPARDLLKKYGDRLTSCLYKLFADPSVCSFPLGRDAGGRPAYSELVKYYPLEVIDPDNARNLTKTLLHYGWNGAAARLTKGPETSALLQEFSDSPYGAPPQR